MGNPVFKTGGKSRILKPVVFVKVGQLEIHERMEKQSDYEGI